MVKQYVSQPYISCVYINEKHGYWLGVIPAKNWRYNTQVVVELQPGDTTLYVGKRLYFNGNINFDVEAHKIHSEQAECTPDR